MKICFWGNFEGTLNGHTPGGGQLQLALVAKALANIGHEVVVLDTESAKEFQTEEGIKVYPIKGWNKGIWMIRTFTHKLPNLYLSLRDQKADVYYCRIRDFRHIFAYWAARKVRAKFILGIASDLDISNFRMRWHHYYLSDLRTLWIFINGILSEIVYPWLLRKSDFVFVQHIGQKELLRKKNIDSVIFHNLIDLNEMPIVPVPVKNDFIYVGSLDKRKGFIDFFELVKKTPLNTYKVVGQPRDKTGYLYYEMLKSFKNVKLLGWLSHYDTLCQIANSKALISTSSMEGFPNVFIESWACGIPVFSLFVDPGDVIKKEKLGEVAYGSINELILTMRNINATKDFASKAQEYVKQNHALNPLRIIEIRSLFDAIIKS